MPNQLDQNGLQVATITEIVTALSTGFMAIYGQDINLDSNTPDGQAINIYGQSAADIGETLLDTYQSFTITGAYGTNLDARGEIIGPTRNPGTYTLVYVLVTVSQALTLYGQDQSVQQIYTIADQAGNQYQLQTTTAFSMATSMLLTFVCTTVGAINPAANTVAVPVTIILGVTSVNNPSATLQQNVGQNQETDGQYRLRLSQSYSLAQTGPADAIQSQLQNLADVTDALVVENDSAETVGGVAPNSIWIIVQGGTPLEIATAIYAKKMPGCPMQGDQEYTLTRPNGQPFIAQWDTPLYTPMYIQLSIQPKGVSPASFSSTAITQQLAAALIYKLGQNASIGDIVSAMFAIAPTAIVVSPQISIDNENWYTVLIPTTLQYIFTVNSGNIQLTIL